MSLDPIIAGLDISEQALDDIDGVIKGQILSTPLDIVPGVDTIAHALDLFVVTSETALENAEIAIKTQIEPLIANAIPSALDFLSSIASSLDSHLAQMLA